MLTSVIIPAFNEEAYLGATLASVNRAKASLEIQPGFKAEIIVVDNASDDSTAEVARALGARVATEKQHNIAKVRNSGARFSAGDVLVFVDADTVVPDELLSRIVATMSDASCYGGTVDPDHQPKKIAVKVYLQFWRVLGRFMGMAQGATQFCRRDSFFALDGYDESLFMGEDVDFYWRLKRLAKRQNGRVVAIADLRVVPSTRRFDQWRLWRTLVWTNPVFILLFQRTKTCWHGWYKTAPR
jgi:glycosyltransferase involved in cell wall biosynthesis